MRAPLGAICTRVNDHSFVFASFYGLTIGFVRGDLAAAFDGFGFAHLTTIGAGEVVGFFHLRHISIELKMSKQSQFGG